VRLNTRAVSVEPGRVVCDTGLTVEADAVVVATEEGVARQLLGARLGLPEGGKAKGEGRGTTCLYYAFDGEPPLTAPLLVLNGEGVDLESRPVNNLVFISKVAPSYAPAGKTLVSVSVVGVPRYSDARLNQLVRQQLSGWFGEAAVAKWQLLKVYRIPYAQPKQVRA
jgi:phytoene dehydrogenase-like protein